MLQASLLRSVTNISATEHRTRVQMSNDVRMLLPTLVGIMVAKVSTPADTNPHPILLDCATVKE